MKTGIIKRVLVTGLALLTIAAQPLYGAPVQENATDNSAHKPWTCPHCAHVNPGSAIYCSQCGEERTPTVEPEPSDSHVCPDCGFVNDKDAKFCGKCRAEFGIVFVPEKGYVPRGTLIEPPHTRKGLWITGLSLWLVGGPLLGALCAASGDTKAGYILGATVSAGGLVMFVVGLTVKTKPVYASIEYGYYDLALK